jgi:hypothetical protein
MALFFWLQCEGAEVIVATLLKSTPPVFFKCSFSSVTFTTLLKFSPRKLYILRETTN